MQHVSEYHAKRQLFETSPPFAVATFNVWFGNDGRGSPYPEARMKEVVKCLTSWQKHGDSSVGECPLLLIGFQEVVPELAAILKPELEKAGYLFIRQPGEGYGCAMAILQKDASKNPVQIREHGWHSYPNSCMRRGFLFARVSWQPEESEILFTTTHLESPENYKGTTNHRSRVDQIRYLETFCNNQLLQHGTHGAIISGDLNWDEHVEGSVDLLSNGLKTNWTDAWKTTSGENKDNYGFTYDCIENPILDGERRCRLDRILIKENATRNSGSMPSLEPSETMLIGKEPIRGLFITKTDSWASTFNFSTPTRVTRKCPVTPSDHYGLVVRLHTRNSEVVSRKVEDNTGKRGDGAAYS